MSCCPPAGYTVPSIARRSRGWTTARWSPKLAGAPNHPPMYQVADGLHQRCDARSGFGCVTTERCSVPDQGDSVDRDPGRAGTGEAGRYDEDQRRPGDPFGNVCGERSAKNGRSSARRNRCPYPQGVLQPRCRLLRQTASSLARMLSISGAILAAACWWRPATWLVKPQERAEADLLPTGSRTRPLATSMTHLFEPGLRATPDAQLRFHPGRAVIGTAESALPARKRSVTAAEGMSWRCARAMASPTAALSAVSHSNRSAASVRKRV